MYLMKGIGISLFLFWFQCQEPFKGVLSGKEILSESWVIGI